jgi:hypothetical protein
MGIFEKNGIVVIDRIQLDYSTIGMFLLLGNGVALLNAVL